MNIKKYKKSIKKRNIYVIGLGALSLMAILWGIGSINQVDSTIYNYDATTTTSSNSTISISTINQNLTSQENAFSTNTWNGYGKNGYFCVVTQSSTTQILSVNTQGNNSVTTYALSPDGLFMLGVK